MANESNESRIHFSGFENEASPSQWLMEREEKSNQFIRKLADIVDEYYDMRDK